MYNWKGKSNKEREVLFIQRMLGRSTSTLSLAQYGEFIPVVGSTEPDDKLLYYKDIVESVEITSKLVNNPDISDTESISFTLDDSGYRIVSIEENYAISNDNTSYSNISWWYNSPLGLKITPNAPYLWNKSTITLSNGTQDSSYKIIASYTGNLDEGITVTGIDEWYAISPYNTYAPELEGNIGREIGQWSQQKPIDISIDNRYVWNYNDIYFSDESTQGGYHNAMIIGDYGNQLREVKFANVPTTAGEEYTILNNRISASDQWWNARGDLGVTVDWDHVSDVTQIQINDVVIIRGIALIEVSSSDPEDPSYLECTTLLNAKVTQITNMKDYPSQYSIKAITLNYIINDAVAISGDVNIETTPDSVYIDGNSGEILYPNNKTILINLRFSSRVHNRVIGDWSYKNDLDVWEVIPSSLGRDHLSILLDEEPYRTLNPIRIKCNSIKYTDDSGAWIDKGDSLSTIVRKEESITKLVLTGDDTTYIIDPRRNSTGNEGYQFKTLHLTNIGVPISGSHEIRLSSSGVSVFKDNINDNTLIGDIEIGILYYDEASEMETRFTATVVSPSLTAVSGNSFRSESSDHFIEFSDTVVKFQRVSDTQFDQFTIYDETLNPPGYRVLRQGDHVLFYRRNSSYKGEYYHGVITSIEKTPDSPQGDGKYYYEIIFSSNNIYQVYYYADLLFTGTKLKPESRYLGSFDSTPNYESLGFHPIPGDRYFNTNEHSVYYYRYDSSDLVPYKWISYNEVTDPNTRLTLLSDSLDDAIRYGSTLLNEEGNIRYFSALASNDAFIKNLMSNYLKVNRVLYSGTKNSLTEISISGVTEDNLGHIIDVTCSDDSYKNKNEYIYKFTNQGVSTYYRYNENIYDQSLNSTYTGYVEVLESNKTELSTYDFDEGGELYSGIEIDNGYYGNNNGKFVVSDKFVVHGTIDSSSLTTINSNGGVNTYECSSDSQPAYYDWNEIYKYIINNVRSIDNPDYISNGSGLTTWSNYSIDGTPIVDIAYITNNNPSTPLVSGPKSAGDFSYNKNLGTYYTKFGGSLSWNFTMPSSEVWWTYHYSKLYIYIKKPNQNEYSVVYDLASGNSQENNLPRGTRIRIESVGHGHDTRWPAVGHSGNINISFSPYGYTTNGYTNVLNIYTNEYNTNPIMIPYTKNNPLYRRDHDINFNNNLVVYKNKLKNQAGNWLYANSYVTGLVPVKSGTSTYITKANEFNNTSSISITPVSSSNPIIITGNQISTCSGDASRLDIYGVSNVTISTSSYYRAFNITIKTLSQVPSVVVKKLLPKDPYVPGDNPQGVDIGDDSSNNTLFRNIYAAKVHNAVWNDYVDMLTVNTDIVLTPGRCYVKIGDVYDVATKYCQKGIVGIHSDTYAHSVGNVKGKVQLAISVSGYVLAYIDKRYRPGTPLTSGKGGVLTKMHWWSRIFHPERLVGIYLRDENEKIWNNVVNVCGRNWIKVK